MLAVNGRLRGGGGGGGGGNRPPGSSPNSSHSLPGSPALAQLRHRLENGRDQQQAQLEVKKEPVDLADYRLLVAPQQGLGASGVFLNGRCGGSPLGIHTSSSQSPHQHLGAAGLDLHLLGHPGPFGKNLSEVQKVLQIGDNSGSRQRFGFRGAGQARLVKNLGDYTLETNQAKSLPDDSGRQEDVRKCRPSSTPSGEERQPSGHFLSFCCQFCREFFPGPIPLHQHERYLCKMNEDIKAVLQPAESGPAGHMAALASEQSSTEQTGSPVNHFKDHASVLKAYFATNTEPDSEELLKISMAIGLPQEFVQEWFSQWQSQNYPGGGLLSGTSPPGPETNPSFSSNDSSHRFPKASRPQNSVDRLRSDTPSPLNLSSTSSKTSQGSSYTPNSLVSEDTPLDLSLPKHSIQRLPSEQEKPAETFLTGTSVETLESGPLDLVSIKKEVLGPEGGRDSVPQLEKSNSPVFGINPFGPVYTSLPPHGAFTAPTFMSPAQATIPGLRPYAGLDPMGLLPHMAYTYATGAAAFADMQQRRKYQRKTAFQVKPLPLTGAGRVLLAGRPSVDPVCRQLVNVGPAGHKHLHPAEDPVTAEL